MSSKQYTAVDAIEATAKAMLSGETEAAASDFEHAIQLWTVAFSNAKTGERPDRVFATRQVMRAVAYYVGLGAS